MGMRTITGAVVIIVFIAVAGYLFARSWQNNEESLPTLASDNSFQPLAASDSPAVIVREASVAPTVSPEETVESSSPTPVTSAVTITISDTEFSPSAVNITQGTKVTFVNDGQGMHWPESSEFNAKHGMQTGETFSYEFGKAGTFSYVDHLNEKMKGVITVK